MPKNSQTGQVALITTLIVVSLAMVVILGLNTLAIQTQQDLRSDRDSRQSYYLAESGLEDALLRIKSPDLSHEPSMTVTVSGHTATTTVTQAGSVYTVTGVGNVNNLIRSVSTTLTKNTTEAEFLYGVQVGEGGLEIRHNDGQVIGSVFSNGTSFGNGEITGDLTVAGSANQIQDLDIGGNAAAYTCDDANITGNLTYNVNGANGCDVGGTTSTQPDVIEPLPFPITQETIDDWKATAEDGGTIIGNYTVDANESLGPVKIIGNLHVANNVTLTLTGVVYITGNFTNGNNAVVQLDSDYGTLSGPIIFDGTVEVKNNGILRGSGNPASFLLVLTTNASTLEALPAMSIKNNLTGAILYAQNGLAIIDNNVNLEEITANKLLLHKATITYNSGLENMEFSTGPSGGWAFGGWQEVE